MIGSSKKLLQAAAGAAGGGGVLVEEVFSTTLYTGTGSAQTITNGIDLAGEGGLVWMKARNDTRNHWLYDTERGINSGLRSDLTFAANTQSGRFTSFNSDGFSIGSSGDVNTSGNLLVSWTFRKAPRFFDVVTYTGDGVAGRTVSHNLGIAPGCIIVKESNQSESWYVYHRSTGVSQAGSLDVNIAFESSSAFLNGTLPTNSVFTLGNQSWANESGASYVAYLFAHDPNGVVACGSFVGNTTVNLGWQPQWILLKRVDSTGGWFIHDTARGWPASGDAAYLYADTSGAEGQTSQIYPNANGFSTLIGSGTYVYVTIRAEGV